MALQLLEGEGKVGRVHLNIVETEALAFLQNWLLNGGITCYSY